MSLIKSIKRDLSPASCLILSLLNIRNCMREKIFQKLKQEYSHLGLGKEVLQAQADALAASGFVTDENIDTIISSQATFLESIQKANDQRATDAQRKAKEEALKEFEAKSAADKKKAEEEAAKAAEEAKKKAEEEALRKEQEKEMPEWYRKEKDTLEKSLAASNELLKKYSENFEALQTGFNAMKQENEAFKLEKAAAERNNLIISKAKELGIPEYRIKEGFTIASDADEAAISEYLTSVSNNIKKYSLPSSKEAFPMSGPDLKKEEVASIAAGLVH